MPTLTATVTYLSRSSHTTGYCTDDRGYDRCPVGKPCPHNILTAAEPAAPTARNTAWVSPTGQFYPVEYCNHAPFAHAICESKAPDMRYLPTSDDYGSYVCVLERLGWLHVSDMHFMGPAARKLSSAQIETLWDWLLAYQAAGETSESKRAVAKLRAIIDAASF